MTKWTIQEVAKAAGTTSRTLRHYDAIGVLPPTGIGENGYRYYDTLALIRLQRILALRDLGMALADITAVLANEMPEADALASLERQLQREADRIQRQIASIQRTKAAIQKGEIPVAESMFDGFQHEQCKDEVEERWGKEAYRRADEWWSEKSQAEKIDWQRRLAELNAAWQAAAAQGVSAESATAQDLAAAHVAWLRSVPHGIADEEFPAYVRGLTDMYVADERFAANYGGQAGATLVRDALIVYLETIS